MLIWKRYQVNPTGGGRTRPATSTGTQATSTTTTTSATTSTGGTGKNAATARAATAEAGRRLVGMRGDRDTVSARSAQGQELKATHDSFRQHTDAASGLVREARALIGNRDLGDLSPKELATVRAKLDQAATHLSQARGIMRDVRAAYPDQSSLWVQRGTTQSEMWNFSGASTGL